MFMRALRSNKVLKDEPKELGIIPTKFSRQIEVPPNRVSQIIAGKCSIKGETALRFGHWFGTDPALVDARQLLPRAQAIQTALIWPWG